MSSNSKKVTYYLLAAISGLVVIFSLFGGLVVYFLFLYVFPQYYSVYGTIVVITPYVKYISLAMFILFLVLALKQPSKTSSAEK